MKPLRLRALLAAAMLPLAATAPLAEALTAPGAAAAASPGPEFTREQAARAGAELDAIPGRAAMLARIRELSAGASRVSDLATAGSRIFYLRQSGDAPAVLCAREGVSGAERVLLDPGRGGGAIAWHVPSPDGRHVAYGLASGDDAVLRVAEVDGARELPVRIDRVHRDGGLAWHPDGGSFYYPRAALGADAARRSADLRVYRHVLGRDAGQDEVVFAPGVGGARDVPEFAFPRLHVPLRSRYAYAVAHDGRSREMAVHVTLQRELAAARPRWRKLVSLEDEVLAIEAWGDELYLLTSRDAPRHRVLRMKGAAADIAAARPVVAQGEAVIDAIALARDALYLRTMVGGVDRLERVPIGLLGSKAPEFLRIPFDHGVSELVADPRADGALVLLQGWIDPPVVAQVDARTGDLHRTGIAPPPAADFSAMDEVRLYAPSHDGVKIPVTLLYRKGTRLTGDNPLLLEGYGAYGVTVSPTFDPARLAWLERGGVIAIAHVRGGGEYGSAWHDAGRGEAKDNTVRDFIAVADFLVDYGFTRPARLAIVGRGAGAIPVGGALVRRPGLFAAAVLRAPLVDLLRHAESRDGAASAREIGAASPGADAEALRALSPYHQVREAMPYPAVLLIASGEGDEAQAARMAARLQQASSSRRPVLLRYAPESGASPAAREQELADIYSFVLWQAGDPQFSSPPEPPLAPPTPPEGAPAGFAIMGR